MENTEEEEEDKLSRMSLADKIKLFRQKSEQQNIVQPPLNRRRRQGEQSRFKTQPVTTEEVEIATNKITPKATPDPRILKSMSMLIAKEICQNQDKGDRGSVQSVEKGDAKPKGILKADEPVKKETIRGILKSDSSSDSHDRDSRSPVKSILKISDKNKKKEPLKSILKADAGSKKTEDGDSSEESDSDAEMECSGRINQDKVNERERSPSKTVCYTEKEEDEKKDEMTKINNNKNTQVSKTHKSSSAIITSTIGNSFAKELKDKLAYKKTNPAVMRRLQANQRRTDGRRNSTNYNYANIMMKVREETPYIVDAGPGLKQRLASLQKSQEDGWKERLRTIKNDDPEKEIAVILPVKKSSEIFESKSKESKAKLRVKEEGTPKARPNSIADRLHLLESSKKEWQKRIEKSDAEQYTVAGKMGASPGNVTPVSQRKRQVPELQIFRSKTDDINRLKSLGAVSLFPVSPLIPNIEISKSKSTTNAVRKEDSSDSENDENDPASIFMQPMSFNVSSASSKEEHLQINEDSFSSFLLQTAKSSDKLHVEHRTVKAQRNQVTSGNPIRKLASRSDLSYSYKEEKKNHAENEWKKIKIESMSKSTTLANSALAGLASIEDFASVSLRKVNSNENIAGTNSLCPYKDKMLLQVKGRRIIQTRMVEPKASSVNKGDCFILVVPDAIYQYIGKLSNVIEKSKSADIVSVIKSKKDLGFRNSLKDAIILDDESSISKENEKQFRSLLDSEDARSLAQEAGPPEDDELYETSIVSTNKVYEVDDTSLVPCEEYWGTSLNYEMLKPEKVFVFDFGSEMYVWHGKLSPSDQRRISSQLAKELWSQGYDYSKCDINPVYPTSQKESQKCCKERPDWALLCKVNQHMETILFKEKFFNWPNEDAKTMGRDSNDSDSSDSSSNKITEMVACDVIEMINTPFPEVDLVLEMSHLGRGLEFHDTNERRMFEIETRGIQVWHAQEFGTEKLCEGSWGQFHSGDTYVVRWHYTVIQTGRALTGGASKHNKVGRDRCAYFFWQGRDSSINEKGACALMTVELDEERGPHVRVIQGKEPPCFLNIFKGSLITHKHKRNNPNSFKRGEWRLFIVLGEEPSEAMLVEVDCDISCLRSRAIFMLIHTTTCDVYMWYGSKISKIHRAVARAAIDNLKTKKPSEMHFCNKSLITVHREHEGNESDGFFKGIGSSDVKKYFSLLSDERLFQYTMRVYRLTSVSGTFSSLEMLCPFRKNENPCAFPIVQADLYKVAQPALFLIDNNTEIFLWQGWHPENNSCPKNRWNKERLCAMETCMTYCKEKQLEESKVVLISAGHEPLDFKNLFPEWIEDWNKEIDDVDCSKPQSVAYLLRKMKNNTYTLEELKKQPTLPEGVDPLKPEAYLIDDEFEKVFEMTKEEFYEKPSWKQLELRKATNLF